MAYNIAQNQRLAQPVSAFEQGRALRLAERQSEQEMRLASQKETLNQIAIDNAGKPDPEEQRKADQAQRERAIELMTFGKEAATRSLSIYRQSIEGGLPEEEARAAAQRQQDRDIRLATDIWGEDLSGKLDPDGEFSPEEATATLTQIDDLMGKSDLSTGQFREGPDYVTRVLQDGMPDMTDAGVLARSPIRESTPSTTINLGQTETEANKAFGKTVGERASDRISASQEGMNQNIQLDRVAQALEAGAETGFGQETLLNLKTAGQLFGLDMADATTEQEIIRKIQNEMALRLRNPESGLGLTGNTSNRDLQFLKDSVLGLGRTPGGNLKIIDFMKRQNQMKIDIAQEQSRIIERNGGTIPSDLDTQIMRYANNYNFLREGEREQIENMIETPKPKGPESLPGFDELPLNEQEELRELWQRQPSKP